MLEWGTSGVTQELAFVTGADDEYCVAAGGCNGNWFCCTWDCLDVGVESGVGRVDRADTHDVADIGLTIL